MMRNSILNGNQLEAVAIVGICDTGKRGGTDQLKDTDVVERIILKLILKNRKKNGVDWMILAQ
jgi:hypothetical protein